VSRRSVRSTIDSGSPDSDLMSAPTITLRPGASTSRAQLLAPGLRSSVSRIFCSAQTGPHQATCGLLVACGTPTSSIASFFAMTRLYPRTSWQTGRNGAAGDRRSTALVLDLVKPSGRRRGAG
jgi:hypothetical protein